MNKVQVNKKSMIESTLAYLDDHADVWQSIAKIVSTKTQLSQIDEEIDATAKTQEENNVTIGKTKLALKKSIAQKADILNDLVEVFAEVEGNDELARAMSDSKSTLLNMSYNNLILRVKLIIEKATANQTVLTTEYGLTKEQLTDLQNDVNRLLEIIGEPRVYQVKRSVATQTIEELFNEANDLLMNRLDKLMSIFKNRNSNFYYGYQKARIIVDY